MKHNGNKRAIHISLKLSLSLGFSTGKKRQEREVDLALPRELPPEQESGEPPQAAQELPQEQDAAQPPRAALVAYFSRMQEAPEDEHVPDPVTALAQWIAALTGGDIHAIYAEEVSLDKEQGRTVLAEPAVPMEQYDVVFLGYPEWWDSCPAEVRSFLQTHDVSDKQIAPFCVTKGVCRRRGCAAGDPPGRTGGRGAVPDGRSGIRPDRAGTGCAAGLAGAAGILNTVKGRRLVKSPRPFFRMRWPGAACRLGLSGVLWFSWCSYRNSLGYRRWACPCRPSPRSGRPASRSGRSGGAAWCPGSPWCP